MMIAITTTDYDDGDSDVEIAGARAKNVPSDDDGSRDAMQYHLLLIRKQLACSPKLGEASATREGAVLERRVVAGLRRERPQAGGYYIGRI